MKKIGILGSTGSIGRQTIEVIESFPESFRLVAIAGGNNLELLAEQVKKFKPWVVSIGDGERLEEFRNLVAGEEVQIYHGEEGLLKVATFEQVETLVTSVTGTLGLMPTVEAIKVGKDIALANKETLVAAGEIVTKLAKEKGVKILPVDSEHSAIFQCLKGEPKKGISRLILTASGGPFRGKNKDFLKEVTLEMALKHPNWSMGKKITIDSATLMNKGLEVLEAKWLFDVELDEIEVVIHPQSIIHSMVEYKDGSVVAQLGLPDMRVPIQYALTYPDRLKNDFPKLNLWETESLTFNKPDLEAFPSLALAYEAGRKGGTMPAVLNAANEEIVALFLEEKINFMDIPVYIKAVMEKHSIIYNPTLKDILYADRWAREEVLRKLN